MAITPFYKYYCVTLTAVLCVQYECVVKAQQKLIHTQ